MPSQRLRVLLAVGPTLLFATAGAFAEAEAPAREFLGDSVEPAAATAPVTIDGRVLFSVRGITSYPAPRRAADIEGRIRALARDASIDPAKLEVTEDTIGSLVGLPGRMLVRVTDGDAEMEGTNRRLFAELCRSQIRRAILDYRAARTRSALISSAWQGAVGTALAALAFVVAMNLFRALGRILRRIVEDRIKSVTVQSFEVVRVERIQVLITGTLRLLGALTFLAILFAYVRFVLGVLPWTHGAAADIDGWILAPIGVLGSGLVAKLPDLVFLTVLFFVIRYVLRLIHLFFSAVGRGDVTLENFDPDWAQPTYNILRIAVIAFAVVVAYPYIPGSSTGAFKGVTLFMGVIFSLGSSSSISNVIAGYTMIYRRAFHVGDVVKIGNVSGMVTQVRTQVTHLRTPKNEEVIVPNSTILGSEVINYTSLVKSHGLILHTTVGIGYETAWRQVEAMLLEAADRTEGLLKEPKPFVHATALGDFAVTYQINAHCDEPSRMHRLYSDLHRNILDVFNEQGVQIMTPAYESDPAEPKIVLPGRSQGPPPAKA
jgi:small-conductance mechanosensitive channel